MARVFPLKGFLLAIFRFVLVISFFQTDSIFTNVNNVKIFAAAQVGTPVDLFLAIDQSDSIGNRPFDVLVDFAEALTFGLANITGFYKDQIENGLRIGVVTFGCGSKTAVRLPVSSDPAYIRERFDFMREKLQTGGTTCLEDALKLVNGFVVDGEELEPPTRATAFVVLTDGKFDDYNQFQDELNWLKSTNKTQVYTVGIGKNPKEEQLIPMAGSEDRYFKVDDADSLKNLISVISAFVLSDFFVDVVFTGNHSAVDFTDQSNLPCAGEDLSVLLYGRSLQPFTEANDLECNFIFYYDSPAAKNLNVTISTPAVIGRSGSDTVFYCQYPDFIQTTSKAILEVIVNNPVSGGGRRRISSLGLTIRRNICIAYEVSGISGGNSGCFGDVTAVEVVLTGKTLAFYFENEDSFDLFCSYSGYNSIFKITPDFVKSQEKAVCKLSKNDMVDFLEEFLADTTLNRNTITGNLLVEGLGYVIPLLNLEKFSFRGSVDPAGILLAAVSGEVSLPNYDIYAQDCIANNGPNNGNKDVCWQQDVGHQFDGTNVKVIESRLSSSYELGCVYISNGNEDTSQFVAGTLNSASDTLSCSMPYIITDPSPTTDLNKFYTTAPAIKYTETSSASNLETYIILKPVETFNLNVTFCADLLPAGESVCLGETMGREIKLRNSYGRARMLNAVTEDIKCLFVNEDASDMKTTFPTATSTPDVFSCVINSVDTIGFTFDTLRIQVGEKGALASYSVSANDANSCFSYTKKSKGKSVTDFTTCWGDQQNLVEVSGTSASTLTEKYLLDDSLKEKLQCKFTYISGVNNDDKVLYTQPLPVDPTNSAKGFYCNLPAELFIYDIQGTMDNVKMSIQVENVDVDVLDLTLERVFDDTCYHLDIANADGSVSAFCYADALNAEMSGTTFQNLISLYNNADISDIKCGFQNFDVKFDASIVSTDKIKCRLPYVSSLAEDFSPNIQISFLYKGTADQLLTPVGFYSLGHCYQSKQFTVIDGARKDNVEFCSGNGLEVDLSDKSGSTISNLLTLNDFYGNGAKIICKFSRSADGFVATATPTLDGDSKKITCSQPVWDPFDEQAKQFTGFDHLILAVFNKDVQISDDLVIELSNVNSATNGICISVASHNVDESLRPPSVSRSNRFSRRFLQSSGQSDCWPGCCQRESVQISFSGNSAAALVSSKSNLAVRCAYEKNQLEEDFVYEDIIYDEASGILQCGAAPGWSPDIPNSGDYKSVIIQSYKKNSGDVIENVSTYNYSPSTASTRCVNLLAKNNYCFGEPVSVTANGLTLIALNAAQSFDLTTSTSNLTLGFNSFETDLQLSVNSEDSVIFGIWKAFDVSKLWNNVLLTLFIKNLNGQASQEFYSSTVPQITVGDSDTCLFTQRSDVTCGADSLQTVILSSGQVVRNYEASSGDFICRFYQQSDPSKVVQVSATVTLAQDTDELDCEYNGNLDIVYNMYQIIYKYKTGDKLEVILQEGQLTMDTDCVSGGKPGKEKKLPDNYLYIIIAVLVICLLSLLVLFLIVKRRRNRTEPEDDSVVEEKGVAAEATEFMIADSDETIYKVGDRVEVLLARAAKTPDDKHWCKGTITMVNLNRKRKIEQKLDDSDKIKDADSPEALQDVTDVENPSSEQNEYVYSVKFDDKSLKTKDELLPNVIRYAKSDFKVKDLVKAFDNESNKVLAARIVAVLDDDMYKIKPLDMKTEKTVSGENLSELFEMEFVKGDIVYVKPEQNSDVRHRVEIEDVDLLNQQYTVRFLDMTSENITVGANQVFKLDFNVTDIVQVQDSEDKSIWRRAVVISKNAKRLTFDVLHSNDSVGKETNVPISRLRKPVFEVDDHVDVLRKDSVSYSDSAVRPMVQDWQPGIVKQENPDGNTFEVLLTRQNKMETVESMFLRHQEHDELIARVRNGVPLRNTNLTKDVPDFGEGVVPKALRFKKRKPLRYIELPDHQFDISVPCKEGLGVQFGWTKDGKIIVSGFRDMPNGDWGALEATGLVMLKDQLVMIDGRDVSAFGIGDLTRVIEKSKENKSGQITMRFGRNFELDEEIAQEAEGNQVAAQ